MCLEMGPNYEEKDYEYELKDDNRMADAGSAKYEVLEYWGIMDAEYAREVGMELGDDVDDLDEVQINAWISNGKVLRAVINPFTPHRIPYHAFSYEKNPYSFFGIGVAENMDDSQKIMNGHARMAIDNLALSGSLVFDVDETALVGGQSMEIYPGKVFRRQAGVPGTAINGLKFPNTSQENMMMFDKFRQLADEQTGIPSYSHGQTGVQSMTRTASGMSMLLGAASLNIKTVIKNLDDFLLKPLGEAYFQWNMQFLESKLGVEGDLEVKATGTASLMQKEVRSQRLTTFLQSVQNPAIAPFVKINKLIGELAYHIGNTANPVSVDGATIEIKSGSPRKTWDHQGLINDVSKRIVDSSIDLDTGEVTKTPVQMIREALEFAGISYWKVTKLKELHLDADEYCEVGESKKSLVIRRDR